MRIIVNEDGGVVRHFESALFRGMDIDRVSLGNVREDPHILSGHDVAILEESDGGIARTISIIRSHGIKVPIIAVGATEKPSHIAKILDSGADNYQPATIEPEALRAFMRSTVKRCAPKTEPVEIALGLNGEFTLNLKSKKVSVTGDKLQLTAYETQVLMLLALNPTPLVRYDDIRRTLHGDDDHTRGNSMEVMVARLRSKMAPFTNAPVIITVRGLGYMIQKPGMSHRVKENAGNKGNRLLLRN